MISKAEIDATAEELGVHEANVQRDYVFGWLLAGLFQDGGPLGNALILKGGNAFRKAYFPHARFSNDLDFSTQVELDPELLHAALLEACAFAGERSGVEFVPDRIRVTEPKSATQESSHYDARVYFKSFYGEEDVTIKVELDVKEFDRVFLPVQDRQLIHAYSDAETCRAVIRSHKLEELLASKLKALLQRRHSPDLYDFVYSIFVQNVLQVDRGQVIATFLRKTIYEPNPMLARGLFLSLPFQALRGLWEEYLVCPKVSLIAFDRAEALFREGISELFAILQPVPQFASAFAGAPGALPAPAVSSYPMSQRDKILEGGRLHRVLRVTYKGLARLVEPYALVYKRRSDGVAREYFYLWDRTGGRSGETGIKSFFPEHVQSVELTEDMFTPRVPVELTKSAGGYFSKPFSPGTARVGKRTRHVRPAGPTYTVECPVCGKSFKRSKPDATLNEHKDTYGNRCYGRVGILRW